MSIDSLMFRNVEMISEDSVNQVAIVPMPVAEVPIVYTRRVGAKGVLF